MPALDRYVDQQIHIPDRNKHRAEKTLCGRPTLTAAFYEEEGNLDRATCEVCRGMYFGEGA